MATTRRRKVRNQQEALALLGELEQSELELSTFCAVQGIDGRSLNCWRKNLHRKADDRAETRALRLVEVVTAPAVAVAPATYRLSIGGVCIVVDDDFRDETLARLLQVAATC